MKLPHALLDALVESVLVFDDSARLVHANQAALRRLPCEPGMNLADLGPGLVLLHPAGVSIMGAAGRNLTVMACCGMGGEVNRHADVAGWPGVPQLGDDVVIEPHSGVLGPVHIGHRVRICAGVVVTCDVDDDMVVCAPAPKLLRRDALGGASAPEGG